MNLTSSQYSGFFLGFLFLVTKHVTFKLSVVKMIFCSKLSRSVGQNWAFLRSFLKLNCAFCQIWINVIEIVRLRQESNLPLPLGTCLYRTLLITLIQIWQKAQFNFKKDPKKAQFRQTILDNFTQNIIFTPNNFVAKYFTPW